MKVVKVKHRPQGKCYWFEVPEELVGKLVQGTRILCATARGQKYGVVVGEVTDSESAVMDGANLPLKKIVSAMESFPMDSIKIPDYMARTTPRDHLLFKRFMEYYHHMQFKTTVAISSNGTLLDGYSAYCVARTMNLKAIEAIRVECANHEN